MQIEQGDQHADKRDSGKKLLAVHRKAENLIAVYLHGIEDLASDQGGNEAADALRAALDRHRLRDIFRVHIAVNDIEGILAKYKD